MQDRMVVADETVWAVWFHREMMRKDLGGDFEKALDGKRQIFVFGKVLYRDVLNPEIILPYETRWIGLFEINEEGDAIHRAEGIIRLAHRWQPKSKLGHYRANSDENHLVTNGFSNSRWLLYRACDLLEPSLRRWPLHLR